MVSIINMDQLDKSLNHFHVYKSLGILGKIHELVCPIPLSIYLCALFFQIVSFFINEHEMLVWTTINVGFSMVRELFWWM